MPAFSSIERRLHNLGATQKMINICSGGIWNRPEIAIGEKSECSSRDRERDQCRAIDIDLFPPGPVHHY